MGNKKISYLSKTFDDYKQSLIEYIAKYFPQISNSFDDASIGSWIVEIIAAIGDNLAFHIDRTFAETNLDTANQASSVYAMARNLGFKIPGPKASLAEVVFSCRVPVVSTYKNLDSKLSMPNDNFMPIIKRGTKVSSGKQYFELMDDVNFSEQFNSDGYSDRTIYPITDTNGDIESYEVTKTALVVAGESKIYHQTLSSDDIKQFMSITLPDKDIMSIESIIFKDGKKTNSDPSMAEFMNQNEYTPAIDSPSNIDTYRFFEVNSLLEQYRWGDDMTTTRGGNRNVGHSVSYEYGYYDSQNNATVPTYSITKGEWVPVTQKFMTEYTDKGYLKITFGSGEVIGQTTDYSSMNDFSKYQVSKMVRNNFLGKLPRAGWTMYVLYRVGGGEASNVGAGTINKISYLNAEIGKKGYTKNDRDLIANVKDSISVTNNTPSISGKDAPTVDEIKMMLKYHTAAQERCVTLKDYENRIMLMPSRYGGPFRVKAVEQNNKVMIYMIGVDNQGKLSDKIPMLMINNILNYLSLFRNINDFVEIKNGRIINISIEVDLMIDKSYSAPHILLEVSDKIKDYLSINKHELGEDIYIGDLEKEIGNTSGVLNVIETRIYNEFGSDYSETLSTQTTIEDTEEDGNVQIDIDSNQYVLKSDDDEMFEIKYPDRDIRIKCILK